MKHNKYLILIAGFLLILSSCKKQLDLQPTDTFSQTNAFLTLNDIKSGLAGAYADYGAYAHDMYVSALISDEAKLGLGNSGQGALTYRYQYTSDKTIGADVIGGWGGYYRVIDQVNRILPYISTVAGSAADEALRGNYKAQLLALRGIAHFELLQSYCKNYDPAEARGVPVMLESNPLAQPKRNTMGEVMDRINSDLADAKAGLPGVAPGNFSDSALNPVNIAAYQARIALYSKDYESAINFSTEVINSLVRPIVADSNFKDIWTDAIDSEVLFRIKFSTDSISTLWTTSGGQVYIAPSDKLYNSFTPEDVRREVYIGTNSSGEHFVNKFYLTSAPDGNVDIKVARISEMYLIRAEAYAKRTAPDLLAGAADLNFLRAKRITGYTNQVFINAADLVNAVLQERFKELAFEGFRLFDLKRNNLPVERLASDASPAWQTLPANNYLFILPIPSDELAANPNMVQNDGY